MNVRGVEDLVEVGRGGTAVVYRGTQTNFHRTVAVKVLTHSGNRDVDYERFRRECRAIGSLSGHPNIVTVFDEGVLDDGRPYLVMEYLPRTLLPTNGARYPWGDVCGIGLALAGALATAHQAGVLHRDVKPENVLVNDSGVPKLSDFGLAQVSGGFESKTATVRASLSHASPEMLEGQPVTAASDVYSLASTLHHLISGRPPFVPNDTDSLITVITRVLRDEAPSLVDQGVPEGLDGLLRRAMSKSPGDRPATMVAFAEELRALMAEHSIVAGIVTAPLPTPLPSARPSAPRRPGRKILLVAAAVAATLGGVGAAAFSQRADRTVEPPITDPTTSISVGSDSTDVTPTTSGDSTVTTSGDSVVTGTTVATETTVGPSTSATDVEPKNVTTVRITNTTKKPVVTTTAPTTPPTPPPPTTAAFAFTGLSPSTITKAAGTGSSGTEIIINVSWMNAPNQYAWADVTALVELSDSAGNNSLGAQTDVSTGPNGGVFLLAHTCNSPGTATYRVTLVSQDAGPTVTQNFNLTLNCT